MLVEFEGAIHEFPDDFTDKDVSAALKSFGKPSVSSPPRSSSLLDRLTAGLAEGIKASGAESDLMTAAGGPVELPSLTDAGTSLARGITSGMMTVPELGAKLLGDAADQEKYKAARLGMADERAEAKKNYGIGGKVLLDMLEGGGSLVATLPVDILTGGITKDVLMADRVARLFSPMLKGVIEASPGFALGMAGRGALTEAADREYDPLTRAARTVAGGVEGLTLGKLFETAMGVGKGLDLPGRLAAQLGVQTPLGVGMAGMEAAKEGRMPTVEELASGAGMGAGFGIFGALKGKPKLDTEALNDFKYERDMFRSELADRVREFAGDRMSDAEADAFTRAFESAELKKQNITEPSAEDYRRGRENLANISEAMRQGFNRERGLNLLEPPGGLKAEGVLSNPIAAEAILRGNKPPRLTVDDQALGVNAALERLLQELRDERALPPGQGFVLKDTPEMSRFSPELAALVQQLAGRPALPSGERGFELQGKPYDPIERFLRDLIAKDRERKALPPPAGEGEGFTFSDSTDSPKTMLRKGEPSWTAGRLPEEGELQVDYKPRLTRGGTPFKSVATAQAAINKLGLQDSFVVVPVEGGYGLKRAGTSPKPSAGEIVEPGATSGGVGQEVPESDRVTGGGAVPGRSDRIKTAAGTPVDIQYAVVPADSLIASHDTAMRINKNYPASLQPRDRTRAASDVQVSGIAKKLDPNFLGESYDAGTGAPIVGKDLVVESGNGRVIAVKMAYENIPDKAAAYREWLDANAEKFGVDRAAIGKMKNPVLVRVRTTPVDRVAFSREANEAGIAAMSAVEQAKVDAAKMKPGLMDLLDAGEAGDLTAAANRDFVRGFLEAVVSPSERGRYLTKDGLVSQEGVNRMRNAVFARAYGESQALSLLSEATDSNIRNITNSLVAVAGKMTQLDDMIKKGKRHPLSISQAIGQAADKMSTLRQQGMSVDAYLKQGAMFDDGLTDQAKGLLWVFDEFKRSSKALTNILAGYVEQVNKVGDPHQQSLLDNAPIPDYNDLIQRSISDERAGRQQAVYPDLFKAGVGAAGSAKEASGDRRGVSEARREWDREPAGTAGAAAEREGISSRKRSYDTAQVAIDFEGARPLPDGGGAEYPLVGEAKIGAAKSDYQGEFTSQDAAQIGRDLISKYPQEHLIAIFTDKNGRPISVMRHVIGGTTSSATYIELIVGKAVNYDAGGIYMVHNHPSGNTRLSDPDMRLFRALGGLLQGTGIEAKDMIAVGPETWGNSQGSNIAFPADAKGKEGIEIPYFERVFASPGKKLTTISGKDDFLRYARKEMPDGGIILLNAVNEVVATMKGLPDYGAIRKAGLRELLGESEKRAAAAMLIYEPNRALSFDDIKNVGAFANAAGLALHDVYTKRGSYREAYGNPQQDVGNIFHEGITSLFSPEAWRRNFIPLAKDLSRAIPRLEALGRFVFDAGKKTAKEWVAAMKSYLGDLWTKFREQLRDIWNNLKAMNRKKGTVGDERGSLTKGKESGKDEGMSNNSDLPNPSRPPEVGGQSGPILYSGIDISKVPEVLKYLRDNFVPGKLKDFAETAVLSRDDVTLLQRIWHAPQWLAKKHPEFQAFFDRQQKREKDRAKLLDARLKGWESARDLSGEERKKLAKVIWIAEGKKFKSVTEPRFLWKDNEWGAEDGKGKPLQVVKGLNLKHYRQISDYLKGRGVPERVIAAYVDIRKNFDRAYAMILNKMVSMKDVDADTITKYRQEIGNISNYFPHQWYGNYAFHGLDANGDVVVRIQYNDIALKGRSARYWSKLKQAKADYPEVASWTKAQKVQQMPEEVYEYPIPVEAMEQIIDAAVARVKGADPAAAGIFRKAMPEAVSDVMKSRGFGGHMIRRKGVKGYEKDDVLRVLHDFDSSFSGWLTKIEAARDFSELLRSISAKDAPGLYSYASRYVKDVLANADRVDRAVDTLRAAIFLNYLGFNLKTGVVNTTQPIIYGIPRLSIDVGWRAGSWVKAAADDLVGAMTKGRNLKADEARLLDELYREGVTQAQFAIEAKGKISGWGARTLNYLNNAAGWFMSITERFNRGSLALAAYRLARDGHIKNEKTLNKYGLKKGQKADYETAMKFAEEVNADANFTYGKGNLPEWLRGRTKLLRAGYSLASFSHNLMQMWGWMLRQGGPGMRAFAMSILGMAIFGGLKSMPFISPLVEAWRKNTGIDPVKALRDILPDVMKDVVTYGAPAAVGVNIGGSLEIGNIDTANPAKFIIGVPWSLVEEPLRAKKAYESGQTGRAVEEMMPTAIKNPMAAWRLHEQGQYSISGQPINMPGQAGPRKISALEAIGKAFGFQPVSSTKARDVREALDNLEEFVKSKQTKWANQYVNAYNRKDLKEMAIIQDQVQEWNRRWLRQDKPEYIIRLGDAVRNRIKPHQEPKKFRPLGLQYTEDNL